MGGICLIGESDPFIAQLLRRFSEESGLEPLQARVGQEVLRLARQQPPELVIIDPDLPGKLRGWEAIHAMRTEPRLRATPVVTCSWRRAADAAELVNFADRHLQKPELHYEDFRAMLRAIGIEPDRAIQQRSDGNG
jgi:two-component system copper resistance phosphate regulon response regulator CusR